jgi:MipA family protein
MIRSIAVSAAAVFTAILLSTAALAQPPDLGSKPRWSLGVAVISSPEPYVDADSDILVVPALSFEYKKFYFRGIYAGYTFWEQGGFQADAVLRPRFEGYEEDDSPFLRGMEDRRISADLGLDLQWEGERIGVSLTPTTDILDRSGGQEVALLLYSPIRFGPVRVEPRVGVAWQSADLTDYYFGVRPEEARPDRPAYEPGSALNLTGGVFVFSPVYRRLLFQGFLRVDQLDDDIEASPIVGDGQAVVGFVSLSYAF